MSCADLYDIMLIKPCSAHTTPFELGEHSRRCVKLPRAEAQNSSEMNSGLSDYTLGFAFWQGQYGSTLFISRLTLCQYHTAGTAATRHSFPAGNVSGKLR